VNHEQLATLALDRHDLECPATIIIAEVDDARRASPRTVSIRRRLLEVDSVVGAKWTR
jgi:hypothetical protein